MRDEPGGTSPSEPAVLAAPDKFRGTLTARQAAEAIAAGCPSGLRVRLLPLSDGGEGLLDVLGPLGGRREHAPVEGPLGSPVTAEWLRLGHTAVVEMARASGLVLAGGAAGNRPVEATTRGTGELIAAAARAVGARAAGDTAGEAVGGATDGDAPRVIVGLGGSATTDGGTGALQAVEEAGGLGAVELIGACDVHVGFFEAVSRFAPQKGATSEQMAVLDERFERWADHYRRRYGLDVAAVAGAGAAGGLGAAIAALGGTLRSGYQVVAELLGFHAALAESSLVITGEGALDATSFAGKAVGSVVRDAADAGVSSLVVVGQATDDAVGTAQGHRSRVVSLSRRFGEERSRSETARCITEAVAESLREGSSSATPTGS